jgi:hypothetical protein
LPNERRFSTVGDVSRRRRWDNRQAEANLGAAAAIIRASPFSAIFAHCQLTLSRSGERRPAVVHTRFTSRPGDSALSGLHSHTRPCSSVTRRDAIVGVSMRVRPQNGYTEMDCANEMEVTGIERCVRDVAGLG